MIFCRETCSNPLRRGDFENIAPKDLQHMVGMETCEVIHRPLFAILVVAIIFCLNIGPRHRLAKIVYNAGIEPAELKKLGIRL